MPILQHGKYQGKTYHWICKHKGGYVQWLCEQPAGKMFRFFGLISYYLEYDEDQTGKVSFF